MRPRTHMPFRSAKMVAECTSAGQFTGQKTIGELLLLTTGKNRTDKISGRATYDTPKMFIEVTSLYRGFRSNFPCILSIIQKCAVKIKELVRNLW